MALSKAKMKKEALERMKMLELSEDIISAFEKKKPEIYISESMEYGKVSSVYKLDAANIPIGNTLVDDVKKFEAENGWMVYHVIRQCRGGDWFDALDIFLCVSNFPDDWEYEKNWFKKTNRIMSCYAFPEDAPEFYEIGCEVEVKNQNGALAKMN